MNMNYMDLSSDDVVHLPRVNASPLWAPQIEINKEILNSTERVFTVSSCHLDLGFADTLVNIVSKYSDNYFLRLLRLLKNYVNIITRNISLRLLTCLQTRNNTWIHGVACDP